MSDDKSVDERLRDTEELLLALRTDLSKLAGIVGVGAEHVDPDKAWRYERPLLSHLSDIRDHDHAMSNTMQAVYGMVRRLESTVAQSAEVSRQNRDGIQQLEALSRNIEGYARLIIANIRGVAREKPLLMRDLFWMETNTTEIALILFAAGEAIIFMIGAPSMLNSAMFRSLSVVMPSSAGWGVLLGLFATGATVAFASRRRRFRILAIAANGIYQGVAAFLPLFNAPGVLGWWPHMIAWAACLWILMRGPSDAPE